MTIFYSYKRKLAAISVVLLIWMLKISAQIPEFHHISVEDGLPNNSVISLTQDGAGFIWMGTTVGLCKYDGVQFTLYKNDIKDTTSISGNHILSLYTDSKGKMWIGTADGLNCYDSQFNRFERVSKKIINEMVYTVLEDSRGWLWVGSKNGLYVSITGKHQNLKPFSGKAYNKESFTNTVRAIKEDKNGNVWIGGINGLSEIIIDHQTISKIKTYKPAPDTKLSQTDNYITSIEMDNQQHLWLGTQSNGVFMFQTDTESFHHYTAGTTNRSLTHNNIRSIKKDKNGLIWIGTQEGLTTIHTTSYEFKKYLHNAQNPSSISQNSVYCFLEDNNGSMWVGTYFGGVNQAYPFGTPFTIIQKNEKSGSLSNNVVSSMVEDNHQNLWIGTEGGGLNFLNRLTNHIQFFKSSETKGSLGSNLIKVVYKDKEENLWIGTHHGGLNVLPKGSHQFLRYHFSKLPSVGYESEISSIIEDDQNRLWVALNYELKVFDKKGTVLKPIENKASTLNLNSLIARYLFKDAQGTVWIAGISSLYTFKNEQLLLIDSTKAVNAFAQDAKGNIWMGLNNSGLAKYQVASKKIELVVLDKFFSGLNIVGILPADDGSLWLSTQKGIVHYKPATHKYNVFTKRDGLSGNEFNYNSFLKDSKGRFYFGGFNGVTAFYPAQVQTNHFVAPIHFTALKLNNTPVAIGDNTHLLQKEINFVKELVFNHTQKVFSIDFALLNYIKSDKNKYVYQLDGFDKDWIESSSGTVTYSNLPWGNYKFMVKAANNDGVWGIPIQLSIKVLPPFWFTWWAYLIYVLLFAAVLFFVVRFFVLRTLLKKEEELHQAKLNFFTNVSHEIRTHLSLIIAPIERLNANGNPYFQQPLSTIKTNAHRLLKLVNELLDFRKAETNHLSLKMETHNIISIVKETVDSFKDTSLSKNIQLSLITNEKAIDADFDEEQLEKVLMNLLSNAFKFTPSGGKIMVELNTHKNNVIITVTDNGSGIAPEFIDKLFVNFFQVADHGQQNTGYGIGLALSKAIIELHGGTISVKSTPATDKHTGKTVFTVILPKHQPGAVTATQAAPMPAVQATSLEVFFQKTELSENILPIADKNYTILIIDDNEEILHLIAESIHPWYKTLLCKNGKEGWAMAVEEIPNLIISDVMMPEMDGFDLCNQIKLDERTNHIPVILLTANGNENAQITGLENGADLYMTKPFSINALILNIRNLLATSKNLQQKLTKAIDIPIHIDEPATQPIPLLQATESVSIAQNEFLKKLETIIEEKLGDADFTVDILAKKIAMSTPVLYKKLRAITSLSVNEFIKKIKLKKAAELLLEKEMNVAEIAFMVGYNDRKYFSREFKKAYGVLPSEYKGL